MKKALIRRAWPSVAAGSGLLVERLDRPGLGQPLAANFAGELRYAVKTLLGDDEVPANGADRFGFTDVADRSEIACRRVGPVDILHEAGFYLRPGDGIADDAGIGRGRYRS